MSPGKLPLDSSYRKLIDQRHLRETARTNIQPSVAWAKLNANWVRGKAGEGGGVGLKKKKKHFGPGKLYKLLPLRNPPHFPRRKKKSPVT